MNRTELLRSLINLRGTGLEIGASYNPLLPKSEGFSVKTVDYLSKEKLQAKYAGNTSVDISRIETVDFLITNGSLLESVGQRESYDYIVASHVIEHQPDLLRFLKDCETLLRPGGALLLAVPDKRYCFDVFQPLTSTGQIIQAHLDGRTRPWPGVVFDDRAYNAVRDGAIGWASDAEGALEFFLPLERARAVFAGDQKNADYIDVHVWKFVPSSFRLIIHDLYMFGYIQLREQEFMNGISANEFYVTMSRKGAGPGIERLTLAQRMLVEHSVIMAGQQA